jgi:hypothetical protein
MEKHMIFLFSEPRPDGLYSQRAECPSWEAAERLANENAWILDGEFFCELTGITDAQASNLCELLSERDISTLH